MLMVQHSDPYSKLNQRFSHANRLHPKRNIHSVAMLLILLPWLCTQQQHTCLLLSCPVMQAKSRYHLRLSLFYRGTRHVRDYLNYNNRMSGPCNGMFKGICEGLYSQKNKQFCLYDRYGGLYSCDWLIAKDKGSSTSCDPNSSPDPNPGTSPSPSPSPSPSTPPSPSPSPSPSPVPQYCSDDDPQCVHPDQAGIFQQGSSEQHACCIFN